MLLLILLPVAAAAAGAAGMAPAAVAADDILQCSRYEQVHTGCAAIPGGPASFCGNATLLFDGATALPNGTIVNGKRFAWGSTAISKVPVPEDHPIVFCARQCRQDPTCVGFALQHGTFGGAGKVTCYTVNSLRYTYTVLVG